MDCSEHRRHPGPERRVITVVVVLRFVLSLVIPVVILAACGDRGVPQPPARQASFGAAEVIACGDSLRPVVAAPAQGLWVSEPADSAVDIAVLIGAAPLAESVLKITRSIESVESNRSGDTVRARVPSVSVSLEPLPSQRSAALGGTPGDRVAEPQQSVAVYVVSPHIRLAAYEPCAASERAPRVRYVRRDSAGRVITDVMLRRASN